MPKARTISSSKALDAATATKTSRRVAAPGQRIDGKVTPNLTKEKDPFTMTKIAKAKPKAKEAKEASAAMTKIAKAKPKAKEAKEASAAMTKIAKAKPKAKEVKEAPSKKIQKHDPKEEVRISRCRMRHNALAKMMHHSSGRRPTWSVLNKSLLWVKRGSVDHKRAIRGERVNLPGSGLYYHYNLV
jgi:hypothetical protein